MGPSVRQLGAPASVPRRRTEVAIGNMAAASTEPRRSNVERSALGIEDMGVIGTQVDQL